MINKQFMELMKKLNLTVQLDSKVHSIITDDFVSNLKKEVDAVLDNSNDFWIPVHAKVWGDKSPMTTLGYVSDACAADPFRVLTLARAYNDVWSEDFEASLVTVVDGTLTYRSSVMSFIIWRIFSSIASERTPEKKPLLKVSASVSSENKSHLTFAVDLETVGTLTSVINFNFLTRRELSKEYVHKLVQHISENIIISYITITSSKMFGDTVRCEKRKISDGQIK